MSFEPTIFDHKQFKKQFPLFSQLENTDLVYFDNAATTQKPDFVLDAIHHFYCHSNANAHRASHRLARAATTMLETTRHKMAEFIGAEFDKEIIFCRGATEALNLIAHCLCQQFQAGDEIILSELEHHANILPWQMAAQRWGLVLKFLPVENGEVQLQGLANLLSSKTRLLSISAASNVLGGKLDCRAVRQLLQGSNVLWLLDASQLMAHERVDVQSLGCDFLVCSAHKFYGPTGVGILYGRQSLLESLPPWQGGGEMIDHVTLDKSTYADIPHRFEAGTSSLSSIAGLSACIDFLNQHDRPAMQAYENNLFFYLYEKLQAMAAITLLSGLDNNIGVLSFVLTGTAYSEEELAVYLDQYNIAVRVGQHCTQPLMDKLQLSSAVRLSLCAYNSVEDVDRLVVAMNEFFNDPSDISSRLLSNTENIFVEDDIKSYVIEDLFAQKNWQKRYRLLMQWGNALTPKPEIRCDKNLVKGCESSAWLQYQDLDNKHYFQIDSDSRLVKGLSVLLLVLINGKTKAEIKALDIEGIFVQLGLEKHLSPSRNNGFYALVKMALSSL